MESQSQHRLYPNVLQSNPDAPSSYPYPYPYPDRHSSLYPSLDTDHLTGNGELLPEGYRNGFAPSSPPDPEMDLLIRIPGSILHLIDKQSSVELACGDLTVVRLRQGENVAAVLACVGDEIQWPLAKDVPAVKLGEAHYFFSVLDVDDQGKNDAAADSADGVLNFGLTIAAKGQEGLLGELDGVLDRYTSFSARHVEGEALDESVAKEVSPAALASGGEEKKVMESKCAAYWTTLAPNVEDYSGTAAKLIASGSGQLIKGILWCGDVTVYGLNNGNKVLKKRLKKTSSKTEVSPETLKRIKRVKKMTRMSEKVATGVLSGVVRVSEFFTGAVVNSKAGKKFFNLLPGEVILASLDGFNKVCDAAEVAGRNVMSTSSTVTTDVVNHRYGEQAAEATGEGFSAAGHAVGTAWAAFKLRKALNPKNAIKASTLAKSAAKAAAAEAKSKKKKSNG